MSFGEALYRVGLIVVNIIFGMMQLRWWREEQQKRDPGTFMLTWHLSLLMCSALAVIFGFIGIARNL